MFKFKEKYLKRGPPRGGWEGPLSNCLNFSVTYGHLGYFWVLEVTLGTFRLVLDLFGYLAYFSNLHVSFGPFRLLLEPLG